MKKKKRKNDYTISECKREKGSTHYPEQYSLILSTSEVKLKRLGNFIIYNISLYLSHYLLHFCI